MFVRLMKGRNKQYVVIVRSYRDEQGRPRQKAVYNFGAVTEETKEQMLNLARRCLTSLEKKQFIIENEGGIQEESRHNWGAPAIIEDLWQRFDLGKIITSKQNANALKLMMIDRLCAPSSKLATYNKRSKYRDFEEVELQHMYRALDALSKQSDELKAHMYNKQHLRGISDVVFFDVTTMYFESQKADLLRDFGYSKDCKFNEVQIVLCLIIDAEGKPLSYELFSGNTCEGKTLLPILDRLKQQFGINKLIIVADRGIGSEENLRHIKDAGYDYIIGAKLRVASKAVKEEALDDNGFCELKCSDNDTRRYKFINNNRQSWVVVHSSKRGEKDRRDRARLVEKAEEMLRNKSALNSRRGAKKFIKTPKGAGKEALLDLTKIQEDARFDGYYAISFSQANASAIDITSAYQGLWQIEESFRILKSFFEVRPMFHWTKRRIEGHIMLNFLLLAMEQFLLSHIKTCYKYEDEHISHNRLRSAIDDLDYSILSINDSKFASYSKITDYQFMILRSLNIPLPKNHKISL